MARSSPRISLLWRGGVKNCAWLDKKIGLIPDGVNTLQANSAGVIYRDGNEICFSQFEEGSNIEIYKQDGTLVTRKATTDYNESISMQPGFYIVRVTEPSGNIVKKKIVLQ